MNIQLLPVSKGPVEFDRLLKIVTPERSTSCVIELCRGDGFFVALNAAIHLYHRNCYRIVAGILLESQWPGHPRRLL